MCGVFGILTSLSKLMINTNIMPHRGPDDWGVCHCRFPIGILTLFQSRLSIIGLGEQGHQPFVKYPGYMLAYNGEIYNFKEIRKDIEQQYNIKFETETDTEVLYEALIHWGVDKTLDQVNGMFAFAFVNSLSNELILVRDPLGIKPLYYSTSDGQVLFASEAKVFFDLGLMKPVLNREVLGEYLANCWVYEPDTLFQNVYKLEAGCYLKYSLEYGTRTHKRYWDITGRNERVVLDICRISKDQTVSDVPVGIYFSGGIDSSILACCLKKEDITCLNLKVGKSEAERVEVLKHLYDLKVETIEPDPDCLELYSKLIYQMDEPIADPAILPAYLLAKKSREMGKVVMLSGMGGDEIDAGYSRHIMLHRMKALQWLRWVPDCLINVALKGKRKRDVFRLKAFLKRPVPENYFSLTYYMTADEISDLVGSDWLRPYKRKIQKMCSLISGMKSFFYLDIKGFLASHNLIYMDKASMAASVEVRVPLLDKDLAQAFFEEIDQPQYAGKKRLKGKLRSILGDNYSELKKEGFTYPLNHWVKSEIDWPEVIEFFQKTEVIQTERIEYWIKLSQSDVEAVSMKLWTVYTLYVWMKAFNVKLNN